MSPVLQLIAAVGALAVAWLVGALVLRIAGGFLLATAAVAVVIGVPGHKVIATAVTGAVAWLAGQGLARAQNGYWPSRLLEGLAPNSHQPPPRRRAGRRRPGTATRRAPGDTQRHPRT